MRELVGPGGERVEQGTRPDRVFEETCPASEQLRRAGNVADEEPCAFSAFLDDRRVELSAEELPLPDQLLEVLEDLLSRRRMNRCERS